ncbi:MAG: S-methyl-5-thioribose-1-phosphate isomerase [Candidatus Electrothrix aestuarii]|uniref:Methylthioribose-1-phosphate isomerase n=1 Tax=Candidatus Electrothrix aestuarii TaxID=3062594 RepID=A0AAU8LSI1_9BACT|nr:S-methyl-5-thioribose-1-phosphate isomerase [Candidatus Electrothrix aestuarii]
MQVNGTLYRCIWPEADGRSVGIIDQTKLPHRFETVTLRTLDDAVLAIRDMLVRGAPLIGATAAYGVCLGLNEDCSDNNLEIACAALIAARPTAVNLRWAVERMRSLLSSLPQEERLEAAYAEAAIICDEDAQVNESLGQYGLELIQKKYEEKGGTVNILTHCNAGWLATVDWGTALAPIFKAHQAGIPVHVWVDETRPRNQGAHLTSWELASAGIDHHLIADNSGGHLMQQGQVDLCIVGTDRTTCTGDVCNKIGTYLKALAAADNGVPFYVALPSSTIDWTLEEGSAIPIEERGQEEVLLVSGLCTDGEIRQVRIAPEQTEAANPAFDVTPARLITGLITERGVCKASKGGLLTLFPEHRD